jgi:hypothetical protein
VKGFVGSFGVDRIIFPNKKIHHAYQWLSNRLTVPGLLQVRFDNEIQRNVSYSR